jgi:group I intron endonuclease
MIIYKSTNTITGKSYIGQTIKTLNRRKAEHKWTSSSTNSKSSHFHNTIRKYGWDNFEWSILCECDTKEELDGMEYHYIIQYDSYHNGYNLTWGGEGTHGYSHTERTKRAISKANKGKIHSDEWRLNHTNTLKGRKYSKNHCDNISKGNKGKVHTDDHKNKISLSMTGKVHSNETKEMMSRDRQGHEWNTKGHENSLSKEYVIIHPDGHQEIIKGMRAFCRDHSLRSNIMVQVAKGKRRQHKGYKCCYVKDINE